MTYQWKVLDDPNGVLTIPQDINGSGQVVGSYLATGGTNNWNGFVEENGSYITIDVPTAVSTHIYAINNKSDIAGSYVGVDQYGFDFEAGFAVIGGQPVTLYIGGGKVTNMQARGINDQGQVVGTYVDVSAPLSNPLANSPTRAFLYQNGALTTLDLPAAFGTDFSIRGIDDAGDVIGVESPPDVLIADIIGPKSPTKSFVYNINTKRYHEFFYSPNASTRIWGTTATGINNNGQMVGSSNDITQHGWGFIGTRSGPTDQFSSLATGAAPQDTFPQGINDAGTVVGYYQDQNSGPDFGHTHGFIATPVPPPVSNPLAGLPAGTTFTVTDARSGQTVNTAGQPSGSAGISREFAVVTTDNLNITANAPNVFLSGSAGNDTLDVSHVNGNNLLDGGGGSNFLFGGSGSDEFVLNDLAPAAPTWSTIVNFHAGDQLVAFGLTQQDFALSWLDNQGAPGYTGLSLVAAAPGEPTMVFTLVGYTTADLSNGRLIAGYGTDQTSGLPYLHIVAH